MPTRTMKLVRAKEDRIDGLRQILSELSMYDQYYQHQRIFTAIKENPEEFKVLSKFDCTEHEYFIDHICRYINNSGYEMILFNLTTLLDNCADPEQHTLEFNPDIQKGLDAVNGEGEFVIMPKKITAENGAKALMMGEFFEERDIDLGDGDGDPIQTTAIGWDNIKKIYDKLVEHFTKKL